MRLLFAAALAAALVAGSPVTAAETASFPDWRQYWEVANSSYVEPNGTRVLQLSIVVNATPDKVWDAFTTAEGYRSWATPVAQVDFRVGGVIETSYDPNARFGDPENIKNQIVAYVPGRLLVIRNIQAPSGLPGKELFGQVASTVELDDLGQGRTRVTLTGVGYGSGEAFDTLYRHFEWGNAYSLNKLKNRFDTGPVDWASVFAKRDAAAASATVTGGGKTQ